MKERHPFEQILDQITDLLALTEENKEKTFSEALGDDLKDKLEKIEKEVELFQKITDKALKKSGIDPESMDQKMKEDPPDNLSSKDKRVLKKAKKLKEKLVSEKRHWSIQSNIAKMQKKKAKTAGKRRKKKFKRLGGQGWLPL